MRPGYQVMPGHARQVAWFKERGAPVIYHTDGDFHPLIEPFLEIGIDCFQPLEAKAGMDVRTLKLKYGDRVAFMGNIDIMVLITNDREKIEAEVSAKIPMAKQGGGYIYHSDHFIAPGDAERQAGKTSGKLLSNRRGQGTTRAYRTNIMVRPPGRQAHPQNGVLSVDKSVDRGETP